MVARHTTSSFTMKRLTSMAAPFILLSCGMIDPDPDPDPDYLPLWREDFDNAAAVDDWWIDNPKGSSVEVDEEAGAMLLHLPTEDLDLDYFTVKAHRRRVVNVAGGWVASTYMSLRAGAQCPDFTVFTGHPRQLAWVVRLDFNYREYAIIVRDHRVGAYVIWDGASR